MNRRRARPSSRPVAPASHTRPKYERVEEQVHTPMFGWTTVSVWWSCSCASCIRACLHGGPRPHPTIHGDGRNLTIETPKT